MAIALSPELVSVTALIPIEREVPLLGGKTLRLRLGVKLAYRAGARWWRSKESAWEAFRCQSLAR